MPETKITKFVTSYLKHPSHSSSQQASFIKTLEAVEPIGLSAIWKTLSVECCRCCRVTAIMETQDVEIASKLLQTKYGMELSKESGRWICFDCK